MSEFRDVKFVKEFTYRTLLNHYRRKLNYTNSEDEKKNIIKIIEHYEKEMIKNNYVIQEYYEVTDILNSLIGLLILPEQNVFEKISKKEKDTERLFSDLYSCTKDNTYINSYDGKKGKDSPFAIFLHIKNSLSHNRIMMHPVNSNSDQKSEIKAIIFQDALLKECGEDSKWKTKSIDRYQGDIKDYPIGINQRLQLFSITIPIDKLEKIIIQIAEYLSSLA